MRGDHEWSVLDERAVVDKVGEVLASRPSSPLPSPLDRRRPVRVEPSFVPLDDRGEVGALRHRDVLARRAITGPDGRARRVARNLAVGPDRFVEDDQALTDDHCAPDGGEHLVHRARLRCDDLVVHLHRLDQGEHVTSIDRGAPLDEDPDDRALQLRCHRNSHPTGLADGPGHSSRSDRRWYGVIDCSPITSSAATAAKRAGTMKPGCPVVSATNTTAASGTR